MHPVFISGLQRLLDQEPAEAGAVDEQVAFDHPAIGEGDRFDEAVLRSKLRLNDLAFDALNARAFSIFAQESRVEPRIEVKGIFES